MRVQTRNNTVHLTYCLNVHAGESWADTMAAIRDYACPIARQTAGAAPFGLGLRLSAHAAAELLSGNNLDRFKLFLEDQNLYVFTVNGFPYGPFHGRPVKERVYAPDWAQPERADYTLQLARILTALLPEDVDGSISTLPGTYRPWVRGISHQQAVLTGLVTTVEQLHRIYLDTGSRVRLAIEPEPDCLWESPRDVVQLFQHDLPEWAHRQGRNAEDVLRVCDEFLGVCVDTCHSTVLGHRPADVIGCLLTAGIQMPKVQISAAPVGDCGAISRRAFSKLADTVYLHQSVIEWPDGRTERHADLDTALRAAEAADDGARFRSHVHIPLTLATWGPLQSTRKNLDSDFFELLDRAAVGHVEVETYTFEVLPDSMRQEGIRACVAAELEWTRRQLTGS